MKPVLCFLINKEPVGGHYFLYLHFLYLIANESHAYINFGVIVSLLVTEDNIYSNRYCAGTTTCLFLGVSIL